MKNPDNMGMPSGQEKEETTKEDLLRTLANFEKIADGLAKNIIQEKQRVDNAEYPTEDEKEKLVKLQTVLEHFQKEILELTKLISE